MKKLFYFSKTNDKKFFNHNYVNWYPVFKQLMAL